MSFPFFNKVIFPRMEVSLTPDELDKVSQFRARVHNIYPLPDFKLLCWLRARDMDLDKAEQMLKRHLTWRKNNEISQLILWQSPRCYYPYLHSGFDLEGAPIVIAPIGRWDLRGCIEAGEMLPALKFILQTLETLVSMGTMAGIYQGVVIIDFEAFSYYQIVHRTVVQGMIELIKVFEANYPEVLKAVYVINAPKIFNIVFAIVKPLLHSRTLSKIQIFGTDKRKWQQEIFKGMTRDQIPPHWGGTKPGRDDVCSELWFQEPLPPNYLKKIGSNYDENGDEWIAVKVNSGEDLKFDYYVESHRGHLLKWAFKTDGYNIGFSVAHESGKIVIPYKIVESHTKTEVGKARFVKPGRCTLTFHNAYSRSRSKIVHYRISLVPVDEEYKKKPDLVFEQ